MTAVVMRIEHGRNPPKVIALALVAPRSRTFHIIFVRRCQRCGQKAVLNARLIKLMIEDFGCAPVVFIYCLGTFECLVQRVFSETFTKS